MADEQSGEAKARVRQYHKPKRGQRSKFVGVVLPNKMAKTATVEIERTEMHRKYKKYIRQHTKVYAHDPEGKAKPGDIVCVVESRPYSKLKRFALVEVLRSASGEQS